MKSKRPCSSRKPEPFKHTAVESAQRSPREFDDLLVAAKQGGSAELGELLSSLRNYLKMVAGTALSNQSTRVQNASDMVQLVQLEAARVLPSFRGQTQPQFRAWIRRILLNKIIDAHRESTRESIPLSKLDPEIWGAMLQPLGDASSQDPSPSSVVARDERELLLKCAIQSLPQRSQDVIARHHFSSETFESIARDWNCSPDAVRKLWARALLKIREKLGPVL